MGKAVLISIRPMWWEKIVSREKSVEIRKSCPALKGPFKCYVYQTKAKWVFKLLRKIGIEGVADVMENAFGMVVGEFVCDRITPLFNVCTDSWKYLLGDTHEWHKKLVKQACLSEAELKTYANGKNCYAWHISDLKIYDKPKPLDGFYKECAGLDNTGLCYECEKAVGEECDCAVNGRLHLDRAPQSWCYVEEVA